MIKKKHQLRFGKDLYIVESIDNDSNYLLRNLSSNDVNWFSRNDLFKSLNKLDFKQSLNEYVSSNDLMSVSLKENGDYTTIDVNDGTNHYYKRLKGGKTAILNEFKNDFQYYNELTPQKLLKKGFTNTEPKVIEESFGGQIFYHGTHSKDVKEFYTDNIFWSTSLDFAEFYGKWIYKAQLDLGRCFDMSQRKDFNWLLEKLGGKIEYYDDNDDLQYMVVYKDYKNIATNNWAVVEHHLDIIRQEYQSSKITEQGTLNYIIFSNSQIRRIGKPFRRRIYDESVECITHKQLSLKSFKCVDNLPNVCKSTYNISEYEVQKELNESENLMERILPEIPNDQYNELLMATSDNGKANAYTKWFGSQILNGEELSTKMIELYTKLHKKLSQAQKIAPISDFNNIQELNQTLDTYKIINPILIKKR